MKKVILFSTICILASAQYGGGGNRMPQIR